MPEKQFAVIGAMSGTSLDGLDLAYCTFKQTNGKWHFQILQTKCINYGPEFRHWLASIEKATALEFVKADYSLGVFIGQQINSFVKQNKLKVDFIASHGHTIFHQPENGFSTQIGNGAAIAANAGISTVCDFRSLDVALKGQGAPLVPIGDQLLFHEFDYCLNLGGFANISFEVQSKRIAFDLCPVNMALNGLSAQLGAEYDKNGMLAKKGKLDSALLDKLNKLDYYKKEYPKSLGKEWFLKEFLPLIKYSKSRIEDKLNTVCEHAALQISYITNSNSSNKSKILCTGGGAYNTYLISRLKKHCKQEIIVPDKKWVEFKEALVFAFLGVLRMQGQKNCLQSVTGAVADNIGGCVYLR